MKLSSWAWAWALSGCLFMGDAMGQGLRQPFSVRPAGFDYNRYLQEEAPSPSDQPAPVVDAQTPQTPAPVVGSGVSDSCASCVSCAPSCCDSCGGYSCGLGSCGLFCCDLGDAFDLGDHLFCPDSGWDLGGWTQLGYHSENDGVFNTHPDHVDLQQQYLYLEKVANGECGIGFGGRVDILYGTDASNTQAFGNNPGRWDYVNGFDYGVYGWALPQAYVEVAYQNLSVKVGHFYTLLGYQVVPATGNFFYSIPYTFNFSEAFTHTGALATYEANDNVTLYGGWTLGWDTGFDQLGSGSSFLGGASVKLTDDLTATYICTAGNLGWIGDNAYTHSFVADWVINDKWEYVGQSDLNAIDNSVNSGGGHYDTIGLNQYLFYTINDCMKIGGRAEWWKADGISLYEAALGINIKPQANILVRPEIRYNWVPGNNLPAVLPVTAAATATSAQDYDDNTIFGVDVILTF